MYILKSNEQLLKSNELLLKSNEQLLKSNGQLNDVKKTLRHQAWQQLEVWIFGCDPKMSGSPFGINDKNQKLFLLDPLWPRWVLEHLKLFIDFDSPDNVM